jgi:hypothetical protein
VVHLQENGFDVEAVDVTNDELSKVKERLGVDPILASCHTAEIDGYIIEGHVPSDVIDKLLKEQPDVAGLAVPGMPQGSPGMSGELEGPMEILAFNQDGEVWVYTTWQ